MNFKLSAQPTQPLVNPYNPKGIQSLADLEEHITHCASAIRQGMCVAYGLARYATCDAAMSIRTHPLYKHKVRQAFQQAFKAFPMWESQMLFAERNRFFAVRDLRPEIRARYKEDLTDREFFDMWLQTGATAYQNYRPMVFSLQNKYKKSLTLHNQKTPDAFAWIITSCVAVEMAQETFDTLIDKLFLVHGIPKDDLYKTFYLFDIRPIREAWMHAVRLLYPCVEDYGIDNIDEQNIILGLKDLNEAFANQYLTMDAELEVLADNEELFRTQKSFKKQLHEAHNMAEKFTNDIKEEKRKEKLEKIKHLQNDK